MKSARASAGRPQLLMIHGLLGSLGYFEPQRYLPGIDVHLPDLAGYGRRRSEDQGIDLPAQAEELVRYLRERVGAPAWVLGHSTGGALAMLVADQAPDLVRGLIDVEGNFTLKDAFWCGRIAVLPEPDWAAEYGTMEDAPAAWLESIGIEAGDERVAFAREILANQPCTTVQNLARSVLDVTGGDDYLDAVRRVLAQVPLHLIGGELSAAGWDVPEWVMAEARRIDIQTKTGHMMMLEDPANFCRIVASIVNEAGA
jgi:pimeloyl-ACP methyl ester carboxylesterase